jgi:CRP-like cAMP-binding protein
MKNLNQVTALLASTPLFNGLPPEQIQHLGHIAVSRHFEKGQSIFSEGDPGDGFFVTAAGRVKIFKVSSEGKEQILHIFGPGEPFGEVPVFSGEPFPASAEAIAECELLFFPKTAFVNLIAANPSLALNMLGVLSRRLRQFTVQIENLSLKEVPGRLASYLLSLSAGGKSADAVTLNISKGQLASVLGTIPETLSRIFSKMTEQGMIQVKGRRIVLCDRELIEALAEHGKLI